MVNKKEEQQQQTEQGVELQEESTETKDPKQFGLKVMYERKEANWAAILLRKIDY